ncbi:hypothetical protein TGAM01_v211068 [Trichoderma gamsii]|uniref:Uncharacterized protein n=1 Tax=Trichoderma gamsii TaxID=398673 RepID=A0A2P4Z704_9HYPO|nr:hypothetical protein TGAM01_v211068 [Trichoderma gamsii]PON20064.1 hypothetical protein TGAM01_v211068 [Trichoderma gamsii]
MAEYTIYTRVYSERSAGKLSSAKRPAHNALIHSELLDEFRNHAIRESTKPTALISASSRIIDTVRRVFDKWYTDGESLEDIWIAFIGIPTTVDESLTPVHAARHLAEECELEEPNLFYYEYVFEWIIPDKYVLHQVSLQTLIDRGLDWEKYLFADSHGGRIVSTEELRERVAVDLLPRQARHDPWGVGIYLALFARKFGARAPLGWVAHQLFYDCVRIKVLDDYAVLVKCGDDFSNIVDFELFLELDDGIDTGLCEWWLTGTEFELNFSEFDEWRAEEEHDIWGTWYYPDYDGIAEETSERERLLPNKAWDKLSTKHEKIRSAIEAEAVKIGL